jgi:hypothetical protein
MIDEKKLLEEGEMSGCMKKLAGWFVAGSCLMAGITGCAPTRYVTAWPWVMCVVGLDYLSSLAYQPSVAFTSAGAQITSLATSHSAARIIVAN